MGYALIHTMDLELLEYIDDNIPNSDCISITSGEDRALGEQGDVEIVVWVLSRRYKLYESIDV